MAYFSNAADLMNYETQYCSKCVHAGGVDGNGCAVMVVHQLHIGWGGYERYKSVLNELIPRSQEQRNDNRLNGGNDKCLMFYAKELMDPR
jgi:hypothetical protein